jgi:hypothetical protein
MKGTKFTEKSHLVPHSDQFFFNLASFICRLINRELDNFQRSQTKSLYGR